MFHLAVYSLAIQGFRTGTQDRDVKTETLLEALWEWPQIPAYGIIW